MLTESYKTNSGYSSRFAKTHSEVNVCQTSIIANAKNPIFGRFKKYSAKVTAKDTFVDEQPIIRIDRALVHKSTKLVNLASNHITSLLLSEERVQFAAVDVHKVVEFR